MQIHNVQQGTDEWHALRRDYFTASEAPAMMGASKKVKRDELLAAKKLGVEREITWFMQHLFDKGHEAEAAIRLHIESELDEELFPCVGTDIVDGLPLLSSFDGLTIGEDLSVECKLWNENKAEYVRNHKIPPEDFWQVVQQSVTGGGMPVKYVVTDGTPEKMVWTTYTATDEDRKRLIAGWQQFVLDLESYIHHEDAPTPAGKAPNQLPALRIEVQGMVTASNLDEFRANAMMVLNGINTDLQSDEDFADAEKTVKWCKEVEDRLQAAKDHALSQTQSIDELFRVIDGIREEARSKRLELDKLVKFRKDAIRAELVTAAQATYSNHVRSLNERLGKPFMPDLKTDFSGVIKGKKTIASLRDAINTEMARAKIVANEIADKIEKNMQAYREKVGGYDFLFRDLSTILMKDHDDLKAIIYARISEHEEAEAKRLEAERERIRAEEQKKAEAEAARKLAEKARIEAEARMAAIEPEDPVGKNKPQEKADDETMQRLKEARDTLDAQPVPPQTASRPTDDEIIRLLSDIYNTSELQIIFWLSLMDLDLAKRNRKKGKAVAG